MIKTALTFASAATVLAVCQTAWAFEPLAKVIDVKGEVERSRTEDDWRTSTRAFFLKDGEAMRTGATGQATLIDLNTDKQYRIGPSSVVRVTGRGVQVMDGKATEAKDDLLDNALTSFKTKFTSLQQYTTVRRNVLADSWKIDPARRVVVSNSQKDLVWQNAGSAYRYQLVIDDDSHHVRAVPDDEELVRFRVPKLAPGQHSYLIRVIDASSGETRYTSNRRGQLHWLPADEDERLDDAVERAEDDLSMTSWEVADLYLEQGLTVAAMDHLREALEQDPNNQLIRAALAKCYTFLRLNKLARREKEYFASL